MIQLKNKYKSFLEEISLLHVYVSVFFFFLIFLIFFFVSVFKHTLNVKRG